MSTSASHASEKMVGRSSLRPSKLMKNQLLLDPIPQDLTSASMNRRREIPTAHYSSRVALTSEQPMQRKPNHRSELKLTPYPVDSPLCISSDLHSLLSTKPDVYRELRG